MVSSRLVLSALLCSMIVPLEVNAEVENKLDFVPVPVPVVDEKELECMAQNIWYEARNEPYEGKLAVATVTMNRVEHPTYPQTVCEVVFEPWQFSWTMFKRNPISNAEKYAKIVQIAFEAIYEGKRLETIRNSMYYHNQTVSPKWSRMMFPIRRIGEHTFYVHQRPQRDNSSLSHYATIQ